MGNVGRELKILRKNHEERLDIENPVEEMKNTFNGLTDRLDRVEQRVSEAEAK